MRVLNVEISKLQKGDTVHFYNGGEAVVEDCRDTSVDFVYEVDIDGGSYQYWDNGEISRCGRTWDIIRITPAPFDGQRVKHGLYKIFWNDGGFSYASVGSDREGKRWFAATNWVSGPGFDWSRVDRVERIEEKT